jgi:hypothetical protein
VDNSAGIASFPVSNTFWCDEDSTKPVDAFKGEEVKGIGITEEDAPLVILSEKQLLPGVFKKLIIFEACLEWFRSVMDIAKAAMRDDVHPEILYYKDAR